jgi:ornithine cyclodeaminase/alanine dehydrogenase-like protein (mu-crystallin family)
LDDAALARARVFVDSRAAADGESGDIRAALAGGATIAGEIGEVVAGTVAGRTGPDEITLFKSLGMAVEDIATADMVRRRALAASGA